MEEKFYVYSDDNGKVAQHEPRYINPDDKQFLLKHQVKVTFSPVSEAHPYLTHVAIEVPFHPDINLSYQIYLTEATPERLFFSIVDDLREKI